MVDKRPHVFDEEGSRRIVHAVEAVENLTEPLPQVVRRDNQIWPVQGKMLAALSAGLSFGANPPTASMQVYHPDPDPANNAQLIDAGYSITITNRDPDVEKSTNDWCRAVFINGEWQP